MNAAPLSFPVSRDVAGLWQTLVSTEPQSLWLGYLLLHRVEAPVLVQREVSLDPVLRAALAALRAIGTERLEDLKRHLSMHPLVLLRLLRTLADYRAVEQLPDGRWRSLPEAAQLLERDSAVQEVPERKVFYFAQMASGRPTLYAALPADLGIPHTPPAGWSFAIDDLRACINRDEAWKRDHHFPTSVREILIAQFAPTELAWLESWQRVILDRAERLTVAVVQQGGQFEVFCLHPQTWQLLGARPLLSCRTADEATAFFGETLADPDPAAWRAALARWAGEIGLEPAWFNQARLQSAGWRLDVTGHRVPPDRLRELTGEVMSQEGWLLVGDGLLRRAVQIVLGPPITQTEKRPVPARDPQGKPPPRRGR